MYNPLSSLTVLGGLPRYLSLLSISFGTIYLDSSRNPHASLGRIEELLDSVSAGTKIEDTTAAQFVHWILRRLVALPNRRLGICYSSHVSNSLI